MKITYFGDPLLRQKAEVVSQDDIKSEKIKILIENMRTYLNTKKIGVGLAAPQIGNGIALAIIDIKLTENRPNIKKYDLVIINPEITETFGRKTQLWEGCISAGPLKGGLFAKVPRYKKIKLKYFDQESRLHEKMFEGLIAHVIQHEVDHLNGVLFVDKVKDTKSYATYEEYMKIIKNQPNKQK